MGRCKVMQDKVKELIALVVFLLVPFLDPNNMAMAATCPPVPYPELATYADNLGTFKLHLLNYKCFGAYDRDIAKVLTGAQAYVERRASLVAKPAIVLDIDETSLSNWRKIVASEFNYIPDRDCISFLSGPDDDQSAQADVIAPILQLFNAAKAKGVAIFFVTSRNNADEERAATEANLRKAGYEGWNELIMKSPNSNPVSIKAYKSSERAKIEAKGFRIIANVGDQYSDLAGGHAEREFKVPNPFYYIP